MPIELPGPPPDPRQKTDFHPYADGRPRAFERGTDFDCEPQVFAQRARMWARRHSGADLTYRVQTAHKSGTPTIVITITQEPTECL